jgi:hypothetical protein
LFDLIVITFFGWLFRVNRSFWTPSDLSKVPDGLAEITGKKYYQVGSKDGLQNHPAVSEAYEKVPGTQRVKAHSKCADASGCTQILNDYEAATRSTIKTVAEAREVLKGTKSDIRETSNIARPKTPKAACPSCAPTMD